MKKSIVLCFILSLLFLFGSTFVSSNCYAKRMKKTETKINSTQLKPDSLLTPEEREFKWREHDWNIYSKHLREKCDTLIIRDNCDYCLGSDSYYYPRKFSATTSCICYSSYFIDRINNYIQKHKNEIKIIIIENPSTKIFELNLEGLNKLHTLSLFGNDSDELTEFPESLFSLPRLKFIRFRYVSLPDIERYRINNNFPRIILDFNNSAKLY